MTENKHTVSDWLDGTHSFVQMRPLPNVDSLSTIEVMEYDPQKRMHESNRSSESRWSSRQVFELLQDGIKLRKIKEAVQIKKKISD